MPAHRFTHLMTSASTAIAPWVPPQATPFAAVPLTTMAASPVAALIYEAALETARRQLARRALLFTWNGRQN